MKREIKFRAWDNRKKKWLCGYEYPNLGGFSLFGETVMLGEWSRMLDTYLFERRKHKQEDLIVMQYTGLKDRNGKEIYEGDILKENLSFGGHKSVEYIGNGFWCKNENGDRSMPTEEYREVIGNIYENPELVKSV